jgi:uncharacterized protein (DUF1800 family)
MTSVAPPGPAAPVLGFNRFGLGARPGDRPPADPGRALLAEFDRYQPRPAALASQPSGTIMAARLAEFAAARRRGAEDASQGQMQANRKMARDGYASGVAARLASALQTGTPLCERLVHFWSNHFAVSVDRVQVIGLGGAYEAEAIRPHLLGRFEDLLLASVRHPAMLLYLDQAQSIGPESQLGSRAAQAPGRRKVGLNENLAREILELHTLGVGGGYSQADVVELARGLTGWSLGGFVRRPLGVEAPPGRFVFQPGWHQPGARAFLGHRHAAAGEAQGIAMLRAAARHPSTAHHIATKLARHFAADEPPPALVARLEASFLKTNGHLPSLYGTLIGSPEAWRPAPAKFRTPWDWSVAALRALGQREVEATRAIGLFAELGQPVWRPGAPAGWPDKAADWAAPDALVRRVEAADRLVRLAPDADARRLAQALLPGALSARTSQAIARAEDGRQALVLLLMSPEFLRR